MSQNEKKIQVLRLDNINKSGFLPEPGAEGEQTNLTERLANNADEADDRTRAAQIPRNPEKEKNKSDLA